MRLAVFSHKPCWRSACSPSGYATDGGFPFQMRYLARLFDETKLLVPVSSTGSLQGEIPLVDPHFDVVPLSPRKGRGFSSKLTFFPWLLKNVRKLARAFQWADAVHAPIPGDVGTVGFIGALLLRKPLFIRYCGNWLTVRSQADRLWHWLMERCAGGRNVMLATGGDADPPSGKAPHLRWIFSSSLTEAELAQLADAKASLKAGKLRLIIVGRQDGRKGTERVIRALPLVRKHYPDAVLDVVGNGTDLNNLKTVASEAGLNGSVYFHGQVDHETVLHLLQNARLFCFPSQSEGFPKAVLEALACGLPVIATPVSAIPMLLSSGCGTLIDPDSAAIATAVCDIASSSSKYHDMSAKARETAKQYSLERWRDEIRRHLEAAWGPLKNEGRGRQPDT